MKIGVIGSVLVLVSMVLTGCNLQLAEAPSKKLPGSEAAGDSRRLQIKAILFGAYDKDSKEMRTTLSQKKLIPLVHPYSEAPFSIPPEAGRTSSEFLAAHPEIVDWVAVELRSEVHRSSRVGYAVGFLTKSGIVIGLDGSRYFDFTSVPDGSYYAVLFHRNHLPVISSGKVTLAQGKPSGWDFTLGLSQAMKEPRGEVERSSLTLLPNSPSFGLIGGNARLDLQVRFTGPLNDQTEILSRILADPSNTAKDVNHVSRGYSNADLNLDGEVKYIGSNNDVDFLKDQLTQISDNPNVSYIYVAFGRLEAFTRTINLSVNALLRAAYISGSGGKMSSTLAGGLLPLNQPYSAMPRFGYHRGLETATAVQSVPASLPDTAAVDWVLVELRSAEDPTKVLHSRAALLFSDGVVRQAISPDGVGPLSFPEADKRRYYVAIRHRNSLGLMTASPVDLTVYSSVNFSDPSVAVYGSKHLIYENRRMLIPGDANSDGRVVIQEGVATSDSETVKQCVANLVSSYASCDINLNGAVNASDLSLAKAMATAFGISEIPEQIP
jgi:hypothetical protein